MSVVLCDDHAMFVESLAMVLGARGHDVVAMTARPESALAAALQEAPDVCILDVTLARASGMEVARKIREASPETKIMFLTALVDGRVWDAFDTGLIDGVVRKTCDIDVVERSIERVALGERVWEGWARRPGPPRTRTKRAVLTRREQEILDLIISGEATASMSERLGVAESTVRTHVQSVLRKLGVHSRVKASVIGFESAALASAVGESDATRWGARVPA